MKLTAGFLFAAIAVASAMAESTQTLTIDPNAPTIDPAMIAGLGPMVPAGNNPKIKKAMESLAGTHEGSSSGSYYTIDPATLPTENPAFIDRHGPQVPVKDNRQLEDEGTTTTLKIDRNTPTIDPAMIGGLGPQVPAGDNPKIKKAMKSLAGSHEGSSSGNYYSFDPATLPTQNPALLEGLGPQVPAGDNPKLKKAMDTFTKQGDGTTTTFNPSTPTHMINPAMIGGLGPAVLPGMPGYGKNDKFNKAWKEFQGASTSGSGASNCPQACPDQYEPVCGTDGVTYSNSCELGIASCKNPEKHIAKASDDACSKQTTQQ